MTACGCNNGWVTRYVRHPGTDIAYSERALCSRCRGTGRRPVVSDPMHPEGIYACEGCGHTYPEYVNGCDYCWDEELDAEANRRKYPRRSVRLVVPG